MNRSIRKARISRLNFDMSTLLMSESLRECFGTFTKARVKYCIFQSHCKYGQDVRLHDEFAWRDREAPLRLHRARITSGDSGEDEETYFDGFALSVPVSGNLWNSLNREAAAKALKDGWGGVLSQRIPGKPMFALDTIDGKLWLTVGFYGWHLGVKHVPWNDLPAWYEQCRENVGLLKYAVDVARSITPEDVMKYYSVKKR